MLNKKYEILNTKYQHFSDTLFQIRALKDFGNIKAGQLGGWVSGYHNLSQDGLCWVYPGSKVYMEARVLDDAQAMGGWIWCRAKLREEAICKDNCFLFDDTDCFGQCLLENEACASGFSRVFEQAKIRQRGAIASRAWAHGRSEIYQFARACGTCELTGNFKLRGNGYIFEGLHTSGVIEKWSPYITDTALCG